MQDEITKLLEGYPFKGVCGGIYPCALLRGERLAEYYRKAKSPHSE